MTNEIVIREQSPFNVAAMLTLARTLAKSRKYGDEGTIIANMIAAHELGVGVSAAINGGLQIIQGRVCLGANLQAALVRRSGRYDYRVAKLDDNECVLEFTDRGKVVGTSKFTIEDAKKANLLSRGAVWKQYPRNMLFARAVSNGIKWFCPDVSAGAPIYTPEEMGADVDGEGNVVQPSICIEAEVVQAGLSPAQVEQLEGLIAASGADKQTILDYCQVRDLDSISPEDFSRVVDLLKTKKG